MPVFPVSADDPRLDAYRSLTDAALRQSIETEHGVYIAESLPVIERAIAAGHRVRSVLAEQRRVARVLAALGDSAPVLEVTAAVAAAVTGYDVHRGVLAAIDRPDVPTLDVALTDARTVVVLDGVTDTTNVGAIFRTAAGLDADAVVVMPDTADPLYRRSIRVSMGTVFQVPWTRSTGWDELAPWLRAHGFQIAALALAPDAVDLADLAPSDRVAVVFGAEGPGLTDQALNAADQIVQIPMSAGVDSLNVASATAVTLWALRDRRRRRSSHSRRR